MNEILEEFKAESKGLVDEMLEILEEIEDDSSRLARLEDYGLLADRIMGTAKSLTTQGLGTSQVERVASYGELCKLVSYKGSQLRDKPQLASVTLAFLLDATEMFQDLVESLGSPNETRINTLLSDTFLDRLRWLSQQFDANLRGTVGVASPKLAQEQIDALLKKIGVGG
jgi:hypothetical protein